MVEHGTVLWFDHSKGHGVIQASGGRLIVVHSDGIKSLTRRGLSDGQAVEYFVEEGPEGVYATHVSVVSHNADRQNSMENALFPKRTMRRLIDSEQNGLLLMTWRI